MDAGKRLTTWRNKIIYVGRVNTNNRNVPSTSIGGKTLLICSFLLRELSRFLNFENNNKVR